MNGWAFLSDVLHGPARTYAATPAATRQSTAVDAGDTWVHDGLHLAPFRPTEPGRLPATPAQAVTLPAVWACVDLLADTVLQLQPQADQDNQLVPLPEWMRRPERYNDGQHRLRQLMEHLTLSMALHGAGYLWADPLGADSWALYPVEPGRVWVELDQLTDPADRFTTRRRYRLDGQPTTLARRWTTRANSPGLLVVNYRTLPGVGAGVGPVQAARLALTGYLDTDAYGTDVYGNGVPAGTLSTDQDITADTAAAWQTRWLTDPKPIRVLGAGLRFEALRLSPKDAAWLEARRFNAEEVARLFGIPAYKLGLAQPGGLTYQNAQDLDRAYLRDSITRYTEPIADALNSLTPPGRNAAEEVRIRFGYEHLLRPTTSERYATHTAALSAGWKTVDEVRAEEGLAPMGRNRT